MASIKQLREEQFLNREELVELLGVIPLTVSCWENGRRKPRVKSIRKLAKVLKIDPKNIEVG